MSESKQGEKTATYENKAMKKASALYQLDLFLDANGILRVGGRIRCSSLSYSAKHIIILPRKGHVTELIICHHHQRVEHQICRITHNEIRSAGYWVIGGSSAVSNHIAQCIKCQKLRGMPQDQKMADLPEDHLEPATYKPHASHMASHMGGVWERQIRSVRNFLASPLESHGTHLDDESLRTFMVEAEAIVNCRPL